MKKRTFVNPVFGDKATILKSAEDTNGIYTMIEVELSPGGGNSLHTHHTFSEKFTVLKGELTVQEDNHSHVLKSGQTAIVAAKSNHCFSNKTNEPVTFRVELSPAQPGFEKALAIAYGLAADGQVNKKGIPKNFSYVSILTVMSGTSPAGILKVLMPLLRWVARRSYRTEAELITRYC